MDRTFDLPDDLAPDQERAIIRALERYLDERDDPHPDAWVMAGRMDATGYGALQARKHVDQPWLGGGRWRFARFGTPNLHGRGDAR